MSPTKTRNHVLRDASGRFVSSKINATRYAQMHQAPKFNLVRWISHNRIEITLHIAFVATCFIAGALGAYVGLHL